MILVFFLCQTLVSPLSLGNTNAMQNVLDTRVSFDVIDSEIRAVFKVLAESFDLNIVVDEGVSGKVTLSLKDVRLEDALDLILEPSGYFYRVKDNVILVQAPEKELVTEIVDVNFVKASEIKSSVEALKSENGSITVTEKENRIIIKDTPARIKAILKEITKVDHPPYQILIEARMIEVEDTDLTSFGVTWSGSLNLAGLSDGKGPVSARTFTPPGATSTSTTSTESSDVKLSLPETSADLTGGQLLYGLTYRRSNSSTTIDALIRTNKAHILASPSIAAMNGEEARIIIGEKFPFRENTLTAVGTTETTKFVDIGVALRVTPTVVKENQILMKLYPEVSSLNSSLDAGPRIDTREANTTVLVENGQTIVIAGLIRHDKTVIRQKVPLLANLPLIGLAFRNKSVDFVTRELAVFVTPYIMRPAKSEEGVTAVDELSPQLFYSRAVRLLQEYGIESLGKSEAQRYSEAAANFKNIARNHPGSEVTDDALYELGLLYDEKLNNSLQAAQAWNQLRVDYPNSPYLTRKFLSRIKAVQKKAEKQARAQARKFR
ncbi:MAG: secretin and TonB N-terminal domain-containing protein [Candidatus Omnitrophica bacterium]|nr:secretin and TonB N-terminal domain-containing protein [Candidatus Omnitrophota bacterium]